MYFHAVKSTAHPPFIGAFSHSTDCIVNNLARVASSIGKVYYVNVANAQCFYPFKENIETIALQGQDSRKLCKFCI